MRTTTCFIILAASFTTGIQGFLLDELVTEVFQGYEPAVIPRCDVTSATNVTIDVALRQIVDLNEPLQILSTIFWIRLGWFDCRLKWNRSEHHDLKDIVVPQNKVWVPDITLYDNADKNMLGVEKFNLVVSHDGQIRYNYPSFVKSLCSVDATYFPFDFQACTLTFGSWVYSGSNLNITTVSNMADMTSYVQNTEWVVRNIPAVRKDTAYGNDTYPTVTYIIKLQRRPLFYILNLLFPCCLISTVALLGFLLPPASGEKMNLGITVMLSLSVFQLIVLEMMPPAGDRVPFISLYFTVSLVLVGLSCLATVVVLNIHFMGIEDRPIPYWVKYYIFRPLARITCTEMKDRNSWNPYIEPDRRLSKRGNDFSGNYVRRMSACSTFSNRRMSTCSTFSNSSRRSRASHANSVTTENRIRETFQNGGGCDSSGAPAFMTSESYDLHQTTSKSRNGPTDVLAMVENVNNVLESLNETLYGEGVNVNSTATSGTTWPLFALVLDRWFMAVYISCLVIGAVTMYLKYIVWVEKPELWT